MAVTRSAGFVTFVAVLYLAVGLVAWFLPETISTPSGGNTTASVSAQLYGVYAALVVALMLAIGFGWLLLRST